jgi:uncharacterized membrane-anchored protein YitT (DUF2179 family)
MFLLFLFYLFIVGFHIIYLLLELLLIHNHLILKINIHNLLFHIEI